MKKCKTKSDLKDLWEETTFKSDEDCVWEDPDGSGPMQGAHLGETLISLDDTYEKSDEDCHFIQEVIRLYRKGKLVFKD